MMKKHVFTAVLSLGFCSLALAAPPLSLRGFLEQVRGDNLGVQASLKASQGAEKYSSEATLLLAPTLIGDLHYLDNRKNQAAPAFQGDRTVQSYYSLGVTQLTTFGLEGKLTYELADTKIYGISPSLIAQPSYFEATPTLTLTQSLWRNGFGAGTRADQAVFEAQNQAIQHGESYKVKLQLADAEAAYWRLALARETVTVSRESVDRAVKIREWAQRRERFQLGDRSDRLQAEAVLELRRLDLQAALDELRAASRAFNLARQLDADQVEENVESPDLERLTSVEIPARAKFREDVLAAEAQERAAAARAEQSLQRLSPDIQVYGSASLNGRDGSSSNAISDSLKTDHPTWLVGLRFSAPLDLPEIFKSREGHHLESAAAAASYDRRVFEQESDWKDLSQKLEESKRRLGLNRAVESVQKEKLLHEKDRLAKGRTTTYQVLMFEQDFAAAQIARIRAENEVVRVVAQMKTYGGDGK